MPTSIICKAV